MSRWFTAKMKMSDILSANYNIILLLPRLGIKLGFGDKSVAEVCQMNDVSTTFVVMVCNCYTFNDYEPDISTLTTTDLQQLTPYLIASHDYYVNERLPHIERHLNHVASQAGSRYETSLHQFFIGYRNEVKSHFEFEEQAIFPLMKNTL